VVRLEEFEFPSSRTARRRFWSHSSPTGASRRREGDRSDRHGDPGAFKTPWSGIIRRQKVNRPMTEWACAENNLGYEQAFGLQEYQMPVANTPNF
jgi:hypothetical protein